MKKEDKKSLLNGNTHNSYGSFSINNSRSSSTESIIEIENDSLNNLLPVINSENSTVVNLEDNWINCHSRYGGITHRKKDSNDKWKYITEIKSNKIIIQESYELINNKSYWIKTITENNEKVTLELLNINDHKLLRTYETYENQTDYLNSLSKLQENIHSFKQKEELSPEHKFLEGVIINTINNIDKFIKNVESFNEDLVKFKEQQDNRDLNTLLKMYKYLTVVQNFIDSSKPNNGIFKRLLNTTTNLTLGLLEIYIGLTGKNLQRVVSNYPIDGKEHTGQDYLDAIFLNYQNYLMVLADTALATFLTSAASSWSRDVIFNKKTKTNTFEISQLNLDEFEKYKDLFETFLYEENHQELMKSFSKITGINDLIKKFNEIEDFIEFDYHPNFIKEVENLKKIISASNNNDTEIKELVAQANKNITQFIKSELKPLQVVENWGRNVLVNLTLETLTWAASHIILTGSSENMSKENFNLQDWITKDIFSTGAFCANLSRYFVMRPINNVFKLGLETWGIPTNLCPEKFSKWVNKQSRNKKLLMAIPLFLTVTFTVNAVKSLASLTTENGFKKATELFYEKFFKLTTLGFSIGVTMIDMVAFAISDFYKDVFNQSIGIKTLGNIITRCCGFNKQEANLFEDNLEKLEVNGKLPTFDEAFKENAIKDEGSLPSTSTRIYPTSTTM